MKSFCLNIEWLFGVTPVASEQALLICGGGGGGRGGAGGPSSARVPASSSSAIEAAADIDSMLGMLEETERRELERT
jgi:hypothetical protein